MPQYISQKEEHEKIINDRNYRKKLHENKIISLENREDAFNNNLFPLVDETDAIDKEILEVKKRIQTLRKGKRSQVDAQQSEYRRKNENEKSIELTAREIEDYIAELQALNKEKEELENEIKILNEPKLKLDNYKIE